MEVEVISSTLVRPASPTPKKALWLSDLDILTLGTHASIYFYANNNKDDEDNGNNKKGEDNGNNMNGEDNSNSKIGEGNCNNMNGEDNINKNHEGYGSNMNGEDNINKNHEGNGSNMNGEDNINKNHEGNGSNMNGEDNINKNHEGNGSNMNGEDNINKNHEGNGSNMNGEDNINKNHEGNGSNMNGEDNINKNHEGNGSNMNGEDKSSNKNGEDEGEDEGEGGMSRNVIMMRGQVLREALAKVLVEYYPMAGRLARNKETGRVELDCGEQGLLFVEATANVTIRQLNDFNFAPSFEYLKLMQRSPVPHDASPSLLYEIAHTDFEDHFNDCPLALFQVTHFKCGGASLGVRMNHAVADGSAALQMIGQWAAVARGLPISLKPWLDRTLLRAREPPCPPSFPHSEFQPAPTLNKINNGDEDSDPNLPLYVQGNKIYRFEKEQIQRLKKAAEETGEEGKPTDRRYSTYVTLAAHVWRCFCKARKLSDDQETWLRINTDGRNRLEPRLPTGYFGNAIFFTMPNAKAGELTTNPLSYAASRIQEALQECSTDAYLRSAIDYMRAVGGVEALKCGGRYVRSPNLGMNSWIYLPIYDADFGWGKPTWMGPALPRGTLVYFLPSPENDGSISLVVNLPHSQISRLDHLLFSF